MSFVFFFFFHRNIAMESTPSTIQQQHMPTNRTADHFSFPTIATTMVCSCRVGSNREYHRPCKINVLGVRPVLRSFSISICICISPLGLFRLLSISFSLSLHQERNSMKNCLQKCTWLLKAKRISQCHIVVVVDDDDVTRVVVVIAVITVLVVVSLLSNQTKQYQLNLFIFLCQK